MLNVHDQLLFLSKDKKSITDKKGNIISIRQETEGIVFFRAVGIESEAFEKKCLHIASRKVCIQWEEGSQECQLWEEVNICTQWELIPKGFSNIS